MSTNGSVALDNVLLILFVEPVLMAAGACVCLLSGDACSFPQVLLCLADIPALPTS